MERRELFGTLIGSSLFGAPRTNKRLTPIEGRESVLQTYSLRYQRNAMPAGNSYTATWISMQFPKLTRLKRLIITGHVATQAGVYSNLGGSFQIATSQLFGTPFNYTLGDANSFLDNNEASFVKPKESYLDIEFNEKDSVYIQPQVNFTLSFTVYGPIALNDTIQLYGQLTVE